MVGNFVGEVVDLLVQCGRDRLYREPLQRLSERMSEAVQTVAMGQNGLALHLIQNFPDFRWRQLLMVQKRNEAGNRTLEVDVVLPERVVCVDEQCLGTVRILLAWHLKHNSRSS